jgi:XTP/dITP diphosphohydrolase
MDIVLATKNRKKIEEIKKILDVVENAPHILTLDDFPDFQDVVEDGETFEENAVKKAVAVSRSTGMAAVADDSGIEVDALIGSPGVFSARFAGDTADDRENLEKLLQELKAVPEEKRGARFVCCIALASGSDVKTFFGTIKGRIGTEPRGDKGFGYDPVFYPEGHDRTFAEMSDSEKNSMSHRGAALREFQKYVLDKKAQK